MAGWTIWIGGWLALVGYKVYEDHTPAVIAATKAPRAQQDRAVGQLIAQLRCAGNIKGRDDDKAPAEIVAKAIIATCGSTVPASVGPPCSISPKCMQELQRMSLQAETEGVLEERYERAQARADDAKAALQRAQAL